MAKLSQMFGDRYHAVFLFTYGDFPHPCCFCGKEIDGHTKPWDYMSAIIHHIDHDRTNNHPDNLAPAHRGCHVDYHRNSDETQQRQSLAQIKRWKRDGPMVLSPEARAKLSASKIGHVVTPEMRAAVSAANTGRKHTPKELEKMRVAHLGKKNSIAHNEAIAAARRGKPSPFQGTHSDSAKEKMKEAYAARPRVACDRCGKELTTNNLVRHMKAHEREDAKVRQRKPRITLTAEQQSIVYNRYKNGETQAVLATEYGVSQPYVSTIVRRLAKEE